MTNHRFIMKKIIPIIFLCLSFFIAYSQDSSQAREHIKYLSSEELHGRGIAYNGENMAASYLRKQLQQFGVESLGDNYFQSYDLAGFALEGSIYCDIDGQALASGDDYRIAPFSHSLNGTYPIIQIPYSTLLDSKKIDKFKQKYGDQLSRSLIYFDDTKAHFKTEEDKKTYQNTLLRLEFDNPFHSAGIIKGVAKMSAWGLSRTHYARESAIVYMLNDKIKRNSKKITIQYNNELRDYTHHNVCGIIRGSEHPEEYIVLCAHYDHLGAMGEDIYFPGAHDNASGCAFLLNMAQYFSKNQPRHSIVFLFFAGEESGLLGSKHFTENPLIPLNQIRFAINFDLLGGGDDGITLVNSTEGKGKALYDKIVAINESEQLIPKIVTRKNTANSDHYFFTQHDVTALFLYTMGGKTGAYHDPSDSNENCSLTKFDSISKLFRILIEKEGD